MKPCARYEKDLLMLLHGQLGPFAALKTRFHLVTCPACRAQIASFRQLSLSLAAGLRRPNSSRAAGVFIPKPVLSLGRTKILYSILIAVSLLGIYTLASRAIANQSKNSVAPDQCAPPASAAPSSTATPASTAKAAVAGHCSSGPTFHKPRATKTS